MALNDEQIQALFDFTRKKLVHYYDLQIELVDHLAASIEDEMERDKNLNFENALARVYQKFGIFGFSKIVQEKEKQLARQHHKLWFKECLSLFHWPQIIASITLFAAIYMLSNSIAMEYLRITFGITAVIFLIVNIFTFKKYRKPQKTLLMMQYYSPGIASWWSYLYIQFLVQFENTNPLYFTIINFLGIIFLVASWQLNQKLKTKAMKLYPEAFA